MIISWVFSPLRLIVISWFITARNSQCHTSLPVAQLCFVVAVRLFHAPNTFFSETKVVILSPFLCIVTGNRQPTALVPLSPLSNSAVEDVDICSDSFVFWFPPCPVTPSVFLHLFLFFTWSLFMFVLPYQLIYSSQAEFLLLPPLWRRHDLKDDVLLWVCFSAWSRLQCRWWATGVGALEMQWQSVIAHVTISHTHIC